nr:reverse transcriptase domain-containing protein [Tanacetum cinerariifolium]
MVGSDIDGYTTRFHELARLVPHMVTPNSQRVNRYIRGLTLEIKRHVTSSEPATIQGAVSMANRLTTDGIKDGLFKKKLSARNKRSFISTNFLPLINMKPSVISLGYDIEIASGVKVETNKIIRGCRLELECHTFIIDLIPFRYGSFDMIIGMDWLSKLRVKIVCYEKIVQIPLSNGDILEVHEEHPEGNLKQLKTMKVNEPKLEDIPVVREFPGVFSKDLLGLPPSREVEFLIDIIPEAMHVAKSLYRLATIEIKELSNQLKEPQEKAIMTVIFSTTQARILEAQSEASKGVNTPTEMLKGLDKQLERKEDGGLNLAEQIWVPVYCNLRTLIMNETHATRYFIHPGADKMYYDLRGLYWWPGMKKDIAMYASKCLTCSKVKAEHEKPSGLLQQPEIPKWKWENITMDFITELSRTCSGHDSIWVIVDQLTKSTHFLAVWEDFKTKKLARLYINEIVARNDKALGTRLDDGQNHRRKPLEFSVGDKILLKVSPRKDVVHFGKRSKVSPRYVRPLEIVERVGPVAYRLHLPQEFVGVYDTFHLSNLKKCLTDVKLHVPLEEVKIDDKFYFVEELMRIMEREVKKLKKRRIPIVKVRWNSRRGPELLGNEKTR